MIELSNDSLYFSFPEVHRKAKLVMEFQRTLRIPDDEGDYPLPPGLGRFPLRHVDDFGKRVPARWSRHGGVMLPMYQSEALWINFSSPSSYPFAVKVAAGKINAVTGETWKDELDAEEQDYVVVPGQPWLDGYCVEKGIVRQFVAMPLGSGYSAEEQLTGAAEHGGIQILAIPLKGDAYDRLQRERDGPFFAQVSAMPEVLMDFMEEADMGLAPGGRMRQEIYDDEHSFEDWDRRERSRCFVHLANSLVWRSITGQEPPSAPFTSEEYARHGLPWFEYYDADRKVLTGEERLRGLKSVVELGKQKGDQPLPENESVETGDPVQLGPTRGRRRVREGTF
jgi:hypothetical protein